MSSQNDLWPTDLLTPVADVEPRKVVEEQAALLGEKTGGLVLGTVRSTETSSGRKLISMILTTPSLKDYEYVLLSVEQPARWYPCRITHEGVTWVGETEASFRHYLASCLQSAATRRVISEIVAMGR